MVHDGTEGSVEGEKGEHYAKDNQEEAEQRLHIRELKN